MTTGFDVSSIQNLLVIVPHQDDEILMAGGLIYEMLRAGKHVTVAIVTNGDYGCEDYSKGRIRLKESLSGLEVLGLPQENVVFLGYADTGMERAESFLYALYHAEEAQKVFPSLASRVTYGLEEKPDYHFQCFGEHGAYTREGLTEDIRHLIQTTGADCVLTTHSSDQHGDHEALFYFVKEILEEYKVASRPKLFVGMVHSPEGDDTWPERDTLHYSCPKGLEEGGLIWEARKVLELSPACKGGRRSGNLKYEALLQYETALEPNVVDYLLSYVKDEEIFWEIGWEKL